MGRKIYPAPNLPLGGTEQYTIIVAFGSEYKILYLWTCLDPSRT
jgi:hypothetical protein